MTEPAGGTLDSLTTLFEAVGAARAYSYGIQPAASAAGEVLAGLDHSDVMVVASLLAALVAIDLRPRDPEPLDRWCGRYQFHLACRERRS